VSGVASVGLALAHALPHTEDQPSPEDETEARPRYLKVVEPGLTPAQRRRRARIAMVASIGVASIIGLALVYLHVVLAQRQFALNNLNTSVQQAQARYQDLRLQVAELGSPQHVISMAEGQLGMVQPNNVKYLIPQTSGTGLAGAATGARGTAPLGVAGGTTVRSPGQAPSGDADWPTIKSQLAGVP
jgi:cell division protein FtsL